MSQRLQEKISDTMAPENQSNRDNSENGWKWAVLIIIAIFAAAYVVLSPSNLDESNRKSTNTTDERREIIYSGQGETNGTVKKIFTGNYKVNWITQGECYYSARLSSGDRIFSVDGTASGFDYLYDIKEGDYFLSMITGPSPSCPWSIQFLPIN